MEEEPLIEGIDLLLNGRPEQTIRRQSESSQEIRQGFVHVLEKGFTSKICTENSGPTKFRIWLEDETMYFKPKSMFTRKKTKMHGAKNKSLKLQDILETQEGNKLSTPASRKLLVERCFSLVVEATEGESVIVFEMENEMEKGAFIEGFDLLKKDVDFKTDESSPVMSSPAKSFEDENYDERVLPSSSCNSNGYLSAASDSMNSQGILQGFANVLEKGFTRKICTEYSGPTKSRIWLEDGTLYFTPKSMFTRKKAKKYGAKTKSVKLQDILETQEGNKLSTPASRKLLVERCFSLVVATTEGESVIVFEMENEMEKRAFIEGIDLLLNHRPEQLIRQQRVSSQEIHQGFANVLEKAFKQEDLYISDPMTRQLEQAKTRSVKLQDILKA